MRSHHEHDAQVQVVQWLEWHKLFFCAIPNGARRSPQQGAWMKAEGLRAGAPDLLIFSPPPAHPTVRGVAIEMKAPNGRETPSQIEWRERLTELGWIVVTAHGFGEAVTEMTNLGY